MLGASRAPRPGLLGLPGGLQDRLPLALATAPGPACAASRGWSGSARWAGACGRQSATASGPSTPTADGHRALGADPQAERGHQLGDVHAQQQVTGRDLAAAQVGEDHRAGTIHQNRVADQPAVRDAPGLQRLHLVPGVAQQVVGDLLVRQRVERCGRRCARRRASPRRGRARRSRSAWARWRRPRWPRTRAAPPAPGPGAATGGCGAW